MTVFSQHVPGKSALISIDASLPWFEAHAPFEGTDGKKTLVYLVNSAAGDDTEGRVKLLFGFKSTNLTKFEAVRLADVAEKLKRDFHYAGLVSLAPDRIGNVSPVTPEMRAFITRAKTPAPC